MIAGVKGSAVFSALLILLPWGARAADDMAGAVRELARKTIAFAGRGEPVSVSWRNVSPLPPGEFSQVRTAFEAAMREAGTRVSDIAPMVESRITLSSNTTEFLLVDEARKGEDRQVWIASWKHSATPAPAGSTISLDKKLVLEQEEQILDVLPAGQVMLVLTASQIVWKTPSGAQSVAVTSPRPWPRDLRGHLRMNGDTFKAYLPGVACSGTMAPALTADCRPSDEPWTLDAGARGVLLANFAIARNHFDGRLSASSGVHKTLAPFFSAASAEENGKAYFVLALLDGRTQILDSALETAGSVPGWGSDIAATEARCAGGSQILATKPGDLREADALRAFQIVNRTAVPVSAPIDLPGPVTALWNLGGNAAIAVVRELGTGHYQAYVITVTCGG